MTAQIVPTPGEPPRGRKQRNTILWLIAGIFAAYLVTNAVMLLFAMRSPPTLVSQSYYEDSRSFEAEQSARQASAAAGWQVSVQPASPSEVVVRLKDRAGRPASGFSGEAGAYRPSDPALDQMLAWSEDPAAPGQYRARFSRPHTGQWRIHLKLKRGGERLDHQFRLDTP